MTYILGKNVEVNNKILFGGRWHKIVEKNEYGIKTDFGIEIKFGAEIYGWKIKQYLKPEFNLDNINNMNNREKIKYLRNFLTVPENKLFDNMYQNGIENEKIAIQQIERTLENREIKRIETEKKFEEYEKEIEKIKIIHKKELEELEIKIKEAKEITISSFNKDDYEIEKSLKKLEALENGGVDNWEWYGEALSEWFEKYK